MIPRWQAIRETAKEPIDQMIANAALYFVAGHLNEEKLRKRVAERLGLTTPEQEKEFARSWEIILRSMGSLIAENCRSWLNDSSGSRGRQPRNSKGLNARAKRLRDFALAKLGYRMALFPLTAFRVAMKAAQRTLADLLKNGSQAASQPEMLTRAELYDLLGYTGYEERDRAYFGG